MFFTRRNCVVVGLLASAGAYKLLRLLMGWLVFICGGCQRAVASLQSSFYEWIAATPVKREWPMNLHRVYVILAVMLRWQAVLLIPVIQVILFFLELVLNIAPHFARLLLEREQIEREYADDVEKGRT